MVDMKESLGAKTWAVPTPVWVVGTYDENGRPKPVPPLILESEEEIRRNREAQARREVRLREKKTEK